MSSYENLIFSGEKRRQNRPVFLAVLRASILIIDGIDSRSDVRVKCVPRRMRRPDIRLAERSFLVRAAN
jgi:hypothetical protein